MTRGRFYLLLVLGIVSFITANSQTNKGQQTSTNELDWLNDWFRAWELVCQEELKLSPSNTPLMVFFDSAYVYSTSDVTISTNDFIEGPTLLGQTLSWRKAPHNGEITLPDGQKVPVGLMTFAAPIGADSSFFVMAAPAYWKAAGINSKELGLDKLLTGVFLHEFAHTQQVNGFGAKVSTIEKNSHLDKALNDDIVQDYFKKDSGYLSLFNEEVNQFYTAAFSINPKKANSLTASALDLLNKRQNTYFKEEKAILKDLDAIFLSMEGLGQYVAVSWLIHPKGGNVSFPIAVEGFRRKRSQWSQEEGLALFLVYKKIGNPNWASDMFGNQPQTIIALLEQAVKKKK